jgi:hypothetical protein
MQEGREQPVSAQLKEVQRRVERWRERGGGKGTRMPEELWQAAEEVARVEGLYSTSRALRVEYSRLKQRVRSRPVTSTKTSSVSSSFVELGMSQLCGVCKTVIDVCGRWGDRMHVEVMGTPTVDIVGLTQTFLSQRS